MKSEFLLDEWLVEPDLNRLSRPGRVVQIEPKVMDVLACLAAHPGEVCSKEKLMQNVWAGTHVSDEVLTYTISELRKALGDSAKKPTFIATIAKRGYRLIAPVTRPSESRYEILGELGKGAMGRVLLAQDTELHRKVALKFLPEEHEKDGDSRERLLKEARAAASLDHPYICKVYDIGELQGKPFLAMEYLDGITLAARLARGPLPLDESIRIAAEIAEALESAHNKGFLHRDLRPSNIMLSERGHVTVMDFGLAMQVVEAGDGPEGGQQSAVYNLEDDAHNAIPYMSPEQLRGARLDQRSDIFSFGCLIYEMLAGIHPFKRESMTATAAAISNDSPPIAPLRAREIPDRLQKTILRMIAKRPQDRFAKIGEVRSALEGARPVEAALAPQLPAASRKPSWIRWPVIAVTSGIAALALIWWLSRPGVHPEANHTQSASAMTIKQQSIAVLPFENLSPDPENGFFADGVTEDIINQLSKIGRLTVTSRAAVERYRKDPVLSDIARDLGVGLVLKGNIRREANQVRISAELIEAKTGRRLWGETYDRELTKIFEIQTSVAELIASTLKIELSAAERGQIERAPTGNLTAYDCYLRGREYYQRYRKHDNETAIGLFEKALQLDPGFALAEAGIADCYAQRAYQYGYPDKWEEQAVTAAQKAISMDPNLAEAHKALGLSYAVRGWHKKALAAYYRAVELNPGYAPAVSNVGAILESEGRLVEALQWNLRAQSLNPSAPVANYNVGEIYRDLYDVERSEEWFKKALVLDPDFEPAHYSRLLQHLAQERYAEAWEEDRKILAANPQSLVGLNAAGTIELYAGHYEKAKENFIRALSVGHSLEAEIHLNLILWRQGQNEKGREFFDGLVRSSLADIESGGESWQPRWNIAIAHAIRGNRDEALSWLEKAAAAGWRPAAESWRAPALQNLRSDARFEKIMQTLRSDIDEQRRRADATQLISLYRERPYTGHRALAGDGSARMSTIQ